MSGTSLSRRRFLGQVGVSAAGLIIAPAVRSKNVLAHRHTLRSSSQVAITRADAYVRASVKERVEHLFESLGGIGDVVHAGDKVAIKINLTGGSGSALSPSLQGVPITESMWTHPEVLRAVGELLIDAGVNGQDISIVEALWDAASYNNFGYPEVQQQLGARRVDLNAAAPYSSFVQQTVGTGSCFYDAFTVNQVLAEVDVYVSIPKLKQHYEAGVTAALKNQVGMVPKQLYEMSFDRGRRGALHVQGGSSPTHLPRSICDLNIARPVHLSVVDGIKNARGGEGVWNPTFRIAEDHVLFAAKDPVACDNIAARLMGIDPEQPTLPLPSGGTCDNYLELLHQRGMGVNRLEEIGVVGDGASLITSAGPQYAPVTPTGFELYQNYPNPFNPATTFRFHLPEAHHVSIVIWSLSGQRVETLVDGELPGGLHQLQWSPDGIASGAYLCVMSAGAFRDSRKMLYQK